MKKLHQPEMSNDKIIFDLQPGPIKFFDLKNPTQTISAYVLCEECIGAIQAAYFSGRPLLVRGNPGLGKTQLATAVAQLLGWELVKAVVHYNSTIDDLLYRVDHLKRLHHANQNTGHSNDSSLKEVSEYLCPGKIWQALAPQTASLYMKDFTYNDKGSVLLIDEIDKADSTLPNALLDVLDTREISIPVLTQSVKDKVEHPFFAVITSNEERALPQAFLRRCAVIDLTLKKGAEGIQQLKNIYQAHLEYNPKVKAIEDGSLTELAEFILTIRDERRAEMDYEPGVSEFIDIIISLSNMELNHVDSKHEKLETLKKYLVMNKRQKAD